MEIQAVGASPPLFTNRSKPWFSKTTLKTHALVVLSYLLVGIGVALACASLYMATMMPPMLAVAAPAAPLAAGLFLRSQNPNTGFFSVSSAPVYQPGQPAGFNNEDGVSCWLNAATQVLFTAMGKEVGDLPFINFWLYPLKSAYRRWKNEEPISTGKLRSWLARVHTEVPSSGTQEDPMALFEVLFEKSGLFLPIERQINGGKPTPEKDFFIPLMMQVDRERSFAELFGEFFKETISDSDTTIRKRFVEAPKGFLVQAKRFSWNMSGELVKIHDPMKFPMQLELSQAQCLHGDRTYTPNAFIVHHGSGPEGGHYTAYLYKNDSWWHANDSQVSQVSDAEAALAIKGAYLVYYAKAY